MKRIKAIESPVNENG